MRWDSLFEDLESQIQEQVAAQLRGEVAENLRVELATEELTERLHGYGNSLLSFHLRAGTEVLARIVRVGEDYFCLEADTSDWIVRTAALDKIAFPSVGFRTDPTPRQKTSIRFSQVLRGIMRDRDRVKIFSVYGQALSEGTLVQVAKDFLVVTAHPRDTFARSQDATGQELIPLATVGWVAVQGRR